MVFYIIAILIFISIAAISYRNLKSFEKLQKIAIVLLLIILTIGMQIGLTVYGLSNNQTLGEMGKGAIALILVVPATIILAEIILMAWLTYVINKYNQEKISRTKFICYVIISILLNDIAVLWFYS